MPNTREKPTCDQICQFNNASDGCVKPAYVICPMVHVGADYSGAAQYNDERAVSPEKSVDMLRGLFDGVNYKSPIEVFMTDIQHQIEKQKDDEIYKAVVSIGINVDKDELIRALKYDRQQYDAGFLAGMAAAKQEWISVNDRLPDDFTQVLICSVIGNQYVAQHLRGHFYSDGINIGTSHWMPLPQPPKGK